MWSFGGVDGDGSCFGLLAYHFDKARRQEATEIMPPLLCLDRFVMVVQSRSLLSYLGRRFDPTNDFRLMCQQCYLDLKDVSEIQT